MIKKTIIISLTIIALSIAFFSIKDAIRTYVPFSEAILSKRPVQIFGTIEKNEPIQHGNGYYIVTLKDARGTAIKVRHYGTKPINLEHADSIVARGKFNPETGFFEAEKILVKCPSRYAKGLSAIKNSNAK